MRQITARGREVRADLDHAHILTRGIHSEQRDQARAPLVAGAELIHQAAVARCQGRIATGCGKHITIVLYEIIDRFGAQLARAGNIVAQQGPQAIEQIERGRAVLVRHLAAGKGLGEGLVFADTENVHLHPKRIECVLEIGVVARQAEQQHEAVGRQMQLVGDARKIVLSLGKALATRQHLLARGFEVEDGGAQLAELGHASRHQIVGFDDQRGDAFIVLGAAHGFEQIGERGLTNRPASGRQQFQRALEHRLFDQAASRAQQQGRAVRNLRLGTEEKGHHHADAKNQQRIEQTTHDEVQGAHEQAQHGDDETKQASDQALSPSVRAAAEHQVPHAMTQLETTVFEFR